jgi:hypothetical protein
MHDGHGVMQRIRAQTVQALALDAAAANMAANAIMGAGAAVVGHRRTMSVGNVVAIGPTNVGPSRKRSRPMWSTMKKPR